MSSIDGLVSGINTTQIITQLMQLERMPQARLVARQKDARAIETELRGMRSDVMNIRTMAADMRLSSGWDKLSATSSNDSVTAAARSGTVTGQLSFNVVQTAAAHTIYSNNTVASLDDIITGAAGGLSYSGTTALGFDNLSATGFAAGDVSFEVTQDSAAAQLTGTAQTYPKSVNLLNQGLSVAVNGTTHNLTIASGTYNTAQDMADAINTAATSVGIDGDFQATVGTGGELVFSTTGEGSAYSVAVIGGTAASGLGFSVGSSAAGQNGIVVVDGQSNTITDSKAGSVTLNGTNGTITADLVGPIRTGTASVQQTDYGTGSMRDVIDAINSNSSLGYSAMAINTGSGYRLQFVAKETGADSNVAINPNDFNLGGFTTLTTGRDAQIEIQGDTPYSITSSSNTFTELMPGVDVTVSQVTTSPVTVTVGNDIEAQADDMEKLVTAINDFITRADKATAANPGAEPGMLFGNSAVRRTRDAVLRAITDGVSASAYEAASMVGISITREGRLEFDRAKFTSATEADRADVERLFTAPDDTSEPGILDRIVNVAEEATATGSGRLWSEAEATKSRIERWGDQIDAYEVRFDKREATLRRQYAALEVALGSLSDQSNHLAGQLAGLNNNY